MNKLEEIRRFDRRDTKEAFCKWLGISQNTYNKVLDGYTIAKNRKELNLVDVNIFLKINKKTNLFLEDYLPNHILLKIIRKK